MKSSIFLITESSLMRMFCLQMAAGRIEVCVCASEDSIQISMRSRIPYVYLIDISIVLRLSQIANWLQNIPKSIPIIQLCRNTEEYRSGSSFRGEKNRCDEFLRVPCTREAFWGVFFPFKNDIGIKKEHKDTKYYAFDDKSFSFSDCALKKCELLSDYPQLNKLIGYSPAMQSFKNQICRFAQADIPIMLTGESGTGKSLTAQIIHEISLFKKGPFCSVNVGTIPESLAESELFGTQPGAFTGAVSHGGYFEQAHNGTLFLDEISELSSVLQVKLLRILEDKIVRRLGSSQTRKVNIRFIFASNADIERLIAFGRFRSDLWYRINAAIIKVPPLRERASDIMLLASPILKQYKKTISRSGLEKLQNYKWPGNIRELHNRVTRACLSTNSEQILDCDIGFN